MSICVYVAEKQLHNKTVSDLEIGDKVRKTLLKESHAIIKGTDPRWTDEVFTVKQIHGNTIILTDLPFRPYLK